MPRATPAICDADRPGDARGLRRLAAGLLLTTTGCLAGAAASAHCVNIGAVYSCITPSGPPVMLSCYGTGFVKTCMDFASSNFVVASQHWRTEFIEAPTSTMSPTEALNSTEMQQTTTNEVDFNTQLNSALMANATASKPTTTTGKSGSTGSTQSRAH